MEEIDRVNDKAKFEKRIRRIIDETYDIFRFMKFEL